MTLIWSLRSLPSYAACALPSRCAGRRSKPCSLPRLARDMGRRAKQREETFFSWKASGACVRGAVLSCAIGSTLTASRALQDRGSRSRGCRPQDGEACKWGHLLGQAASGQVGLERLVVECVSHVYKCVWKVASSRQQTLYDRVPVSQEELPCSPSLHAAWRGQVVQLMCALWHAC